MQKLILLLSFGFLCFLGKATQNDSIFISSKEYQILNEKVIQIEKEKVELNQKTVSIQTENDKRFSDLYTNLSIWVSAIFVLLGGILFLNWQNSKGVAKEQAENELKDIKDKICDAENDLNELQEEIDTISTTIKTLKKKSL